VLYLLGQEGHPPSGHVSGYLTSDGKEVRPEALWGNVGRPEDLDSDVEPEWAPEPLRFDDIY
jgi:hypothetical protein